MMYERCEFLKSSSSGILSYKIKSRKAGKKERKNERKTKHRVSALWVWAVKCQFLAQFKTSWPDERTLI